MKELTARAARRWLLKAKGRVWLERVFLPRLHPVAISALLLTLVLIFAFQADNLTGRLLHLFTLALLATLGPVAGRSAESAGTNPITCRALVMSR